MLKIILVLSPFFAWYTPSQMSRSETRSPKEVVDDFWRLETNGGRLTSEGRRKAEEFLITSSDSMADPKTIEVVHKDYAVSEPTINGTVAEVIVSAGSEGRIDQTLRFRPSEAFKEGLLFRLELLDQPTPGPNRGAHGAPQWRIKTPSVLYLTANSAIRYVGALESKTTDPTVKKNATETLTKLKLIAQRR